MKRFFFVFLFGCLFKGANLVGIHRNHLAIEKFGATIKIV